MNTTADDTRTLEDTLTRSDRASHIEALVRQLGGAERALQELLADEVDAVVDPVSGTPLILRHAQTELRRSEARMRLLLEQVPAVVWTTDLHLRLTSVGGRALDDLGATAQALIGCSLADMTQEQEGLAPVLEAHRRALEGQRVPYETRMGSRVFQGAVEPAYDGGGQISGCVGVGLDVTEHKQAQEALIESEKLALTGRMAASLAHEINNPLQAVIGCLSLAEEDLRAGKDALRYIAIALEELERAADLVARMRDLNRPPDAADREPTDVNALVERVLTLTQKRCQEGRVEVAWAPGAALPQPALRADRMQQVFLNVVLNAVEAMPDGGRLAVWTERSNEPQGVCIGFADTGVGIPAGELSRLFEPYYTTKTLCLGLGLAVSHTIVQDHGGRIEVESVVGEGTSFVVWLPAQEGEERWRT